MICPRCGQGTVRRVRLVALDRAGYLCDECEALWFSASTMGPDGFIDFGTFMASHARPALWSEIEALPEEPSADARAEEAS